MGSRYSIEELKQIEALVNEGCSNREIAEQLGKSEAGIRNLRYRKRLTKKTENEIKALLQKRDTLASSISRLEAKQRELQLSIEHLEQKKQRVEQFLQLSKSQLQWVLIEALKMLRWNRPELFILSGPEQLGWPWDQDERKIQGETYNALVKNNSNAPVKMYLNLVDLGKPRIVMTWTDKDMDKLNAKGGIWGKDSVIKKWVSESTDGEAYQDAYIAVNISVKN